MNYGIPRLPLAIDLETIEKLMDNLERFINDDTLSPLDPLVKMAVIHHQFESIHPFYDGNGRTGRIINILYLVAGGLLDLPILYLSRYINRHKTEYYRLIQDIRTDKIDNAQQWEAWALFMLRCVETTAKETICLVERMATMMNQFKQTRRPILGKQYKHELLNNLFLHPYTKNRIRGTRSASRTNYRHQKTSSSTDLHPKKTAAGPTYRRFSLETPKRYSFSIAATPGNSLPSMNSNMAPPPVEM